MKNKLLLSAILTVAVVVSSCTGPQQAQLSQLAVDGFKAYLDSKKQAATGKTVAKSAKPTTF